MSLPARQTLRPDARRRHFFHRTRARALFKGAGGRSGGAQAVQTPARAALAPRGATTPPPNANGELGGSIRRFAASDFLPNGVRSLPGHNGSAWPPDAGGDIDARMRSLRAA